ncbi:MAG: hypothetical protein JO190_10785 [Candidatus Eremiobacteraeota bacterium]|nr:hypothetical protein [Candidatus Eremiobacteraeota bacterium]MBV8499191.1 hypothetical protein [Candidatus Eremiobacteraeota bacterium]
MRPSRSVTSRTRLIIFIFMITALGVSVGSGAAVNAHPGSFLKSGTTSVCGTTAIICYNIETVDYKPGENNFITGINNFDNIVGAYSAATTANAIYHSFEAAPNPVPTAYTGQFVNEKSPYKSTFLQGLDNNQKLSNSYVVGYAGNICGSCSTVGVIYNNKNNTWTTVQDNNNGSCPVDTQVLAMTNPQQGVGFYLKPNSLGKCEQQAFEFYPKSGGTSDQFTYVDFNPPPATSGATVVSSTANGVNELGDVVGTETYGSPHRQAAWVYSELTYYTFKNGSYNTFGRGIDFNDRVVGDYIDGVGATHGFLVENPVSPTFITIDYPVTPAYTVINSISLETDKKDGFLSAISGWYFEGGLYHGFVGTCNTTCPNVGKTIPGLESHLKTVRPPSR